MFHVCRFWHACRGFLALIFVWPEEVMPLAQRLQMCRREGQEIMVKKPTLGHLSKFVAETLRAQTRNIRRHFAFDNFWPLPVGAAIFMATKSGQTVELHGVAIVSHTTVRFPQVLLKCSTSMRPWWGSTVPTSVLSLCRKGKSIYIAWDLMRFAKGRRYLPRVWCRTFKCSFTSSNYTTQLVASHDRYLRVSECHQGFLRVSFNFVSGCTWGDWMNSVLFSLNDLVAHAAASYRLNEDHATLF